MTGSLDPTEHHIKSFLKVTHPKGPNLHKFKMAAMSEFNVQQTFFLGGFRAHKCIANI